MALTRSTICRVLARSLACVSGPLFVLAAALAGCSPASPPAPARADAGASGSVADARPATGDDSAVLPEAAAADLASTTDTATAGAADLAEVSPTSASDARDTTSAEVARPEAGADLTAGDAAAPTGVVKVMVLGSSNELGTCWRAYLWQKLRAQGITSFDFVGAQNAGPDCGVPGYDKDTESRNGNVISRITAAQWTAMFRASSPDIVISHVGGADLLQGVPNPRIVEAFDLHVNQGRALNPNMKFLVGQHTPMEPASCANCRAKVMDLNAGIAAWAMTKTSAASPVVAVDLFTGLDVATDTSDRVHLTNSGSQKVAEKWLAVMAPLFKP